MTPSIHRSPYSPLPWPRPAASGPLSRYLAGPVLLICALTVGCGDNITEVTPDAAAPTAECGDGVVAGDEQCDDGNTDDGDACSATCTLTCGDGEVAANEQCDIAIESGDGACPDACDDGDACTVDSLVGEACDAQCQAVLITETVDDDGCCPSGAGSGEDTDCPDAVCGNGVPEAGEQCDDGDDKAGDGCDDCVLEDATPTAFRIVALAFSDPHAFVNLGVCLDLTSELNGLISASFSADDNNDDILDLSLVAVFRPLAQSAPTVPMDIVFADCTAPAAGTTCSPPSGGPPTTTTAANNSDAGTCLGVVAGTARPYKTPVTEAVAPCFASNSETLSLDLLDVVVELTDAQVAATYVGDPATGVTNGLMRGFISETAADAVILPDDLPLVGGQPLSSLLPGGTGNCDSGDDRDVGPGGVTGWWLYLNFVAERVSWSE
ncbi:MAG: DUF4215 domain-containing protein [Myxococcota bacterium]